MVKLEELIAEHCPEGVEYKKLGDVFDMKNGYTPSRKNKDYWTDGTIPWFTLKDIRENGSILNDAIEHVHESGVKGDLIPANSLIFSTTATVGVYGLIGTSFICNQQFTSLTDNGEYDVNMKFMYYYMGVISRESKDNLRQSSFPTISRRWFSSVLIPLPPIEVQNEIVRILDTFTELTHEITHELTLRKQQYEHYRDKLLTIDEDVTMKKLGDVCEIGTGRGNRQDAITDGEYPFYVRSAEPLKSDTYLYDEEAIIVPGEGRVGEIYHYVVGKYNLHQRAYRIASKDNTVNLKYVLYYMKSHFKEFILRRAVTGTVLSIRKAMLTDYPIPIPPIEVQNEIVETLDRFNTLANDIERGLPKEIELRTKQYEYYRDKLLTFDEVTT